MKEIECPACGHNFHHEAEGEEKAAAEPEHKHEKPKSFAEAVRARKKGK